MSAQPQGATTGPFLAAGIAAPVLYVLIVVLGGAITPDYSHVAEPVSALIAAEADHARALSALFAVYNLLVLAFAVGLWRVAREDGWIRGAALVLGIVGLAGLALLVFPMDMPDDPTTVSGVFHLVLAGLSSLGSILVIMLAAIGWHRQGRAGLAGFGYLMAAAVVATGAAAAYAAVAGWGAVGVLERLTIGFFLAWLLGTAVVILRHRN